jgi:hypothetical protein
MPHRFSTELAPGELDSTPWEGVIDRVRAQMVGAGAPAEASAAAAAKTCARTLARTHSRLLVALDGRSNAGVDSVSELVAVAVKLLQGVSALCEAYGQRAVDVRSELDEALAQRLDAHEHGVLSGELSYCVRAAEADERAALTRKLLAGLSRETSPSPVGLRLLRSAAVDVAALVVRVAGNAAAGGRGDQAPEVRSAILDQTLIAVSLELAARARAVERAVDGRGDVVAHHLAAGLRMRVSEKTLPVLAPADAGASERSRPDAARGAWVVLATHEYVAVNALDGQLEVPTYRKRFTGLTEAIVEGAANVVCGGRLAGRPSAFRHREAWGHHAVALTYALEAYVGGLRGDPGSFARAQLIALTRLVRAVAAIALLEIRRAGEQPGQRKPHPVTAIDLTVRSRDV